MGAQGTWALSPAPPLSALGPSLGHSLSLGRLNFPSSQDNSGMNTVDQTSALWWSEHGPAMEANQVYHGQVEEASTAVPSTKVLTLRTGRQAKTLLTQA